MISAAVSPTRPAFYGFKSLIDIDKPNFQSSHFTANWKSSINIQYTNERFRGAQTAVMPRFNTATLLIVLASVQPIVAVDAVNGNFARDFIIGLSVAAAVTIVFTILVCVCAQCGPSIIGRYCFGRRRPSEEEWFEPDPYEKRHFPFVQSSNALVPSYA